MEKNMQNSKLLLLCWLTIKNQITEYEQFKRTLPVESIIVFSQIFFNKITRWCVFWQDFRPSFCVQFLDKGKQFMAKKIDCLRDFGFVLE